MVGALTCVSAVCGFLGNFYWILDLTSHFRVQYVTVLITLAVVFAVGRKFKPTLVFVCFAIVNLAVVLPYCLTGRNVVRPADSKIRVVLINVHTENQQYHLVENFVQQSNPDVLLLEEVDDSWMRRLEGLRDLLPYFYSEPRSDNFGIALFSKLPLTNAGIHYLGDAEVPSVSAEIEIGGRHVLFVGTHPLPPGSTDNTRLRNEQLAAVAGFVLDQQNSVILAGDLNTTPWSGSFRKFLKKSKLTDSARGFGYQPTWPAGLLPLLIPLDHCLISSDLRVISRKRGAYVGSDHFPLVVEIGIPRKDGQ